MIQLDPNSYSFSSSPTSTGRLIASYPSYTAGECTFTINWPASCGDQPPTAVCKDGTIDIYSPGGCAPVTTINPDAIDNGSTDDGTITSKAVSFPSGMTELDVGNEYQVTLTVTDDSAQTATCTSTVSIQDVDSDGDNIDDCDDMCPDSALDNVDRLKPNHFQFDSASGGNVDFSTIVNDDLFRGKGNQMSFTMIGTHGCTCKDIVEVCKYGQGHSKFGCSSGAMDLFTDPFGPYCEGEDGLTYEAFPY